RYELMTISTSAICALLILLLSLLFMSKSHPPQPRSTLFPYTTLFRSSSPITCNVNHNFTARAGRVNSIPRISGSITSSSDVISRSEEHTSELQSRFDIVCRLLLEKKNIYKYKKINNADNRLRH